MKITIVDGLIIKNKKLLLLKKFSKDYYELPGGKVKKGEDLRACLERELFEELGIKLTKFKEILKLKFNFENKEITDHIFIIADLKGTPQLKEKDVFEDMIWINWKDCLNLKLAPNVKKLIKRKNVSNMFINL